MELLRANRAIAACPQLREEISTIVEFEVDGSTQVLNLIQVVQKVGLEAICRAVVRPLAEIRPACYYGCLLTRRRETLQFDDCEQPSSMETMLAGVGRGAGPLELQDRVLRRGMTMANEDDRAGSVPQNSRATPWRTAPRASWWLVRCAT